MSGYSLSFFLSFFLDNFLFFLEFIWFGDWFIHCWERIHKDTLDMILAFRLGLRLVNDLFLSQLDTFILTLSLFVVTLINPDLPCWPELHYEYNHDTHFSEKLVKPQSDTCDVPIKKKEKVLIQEQALGIFGTGRNTCYNISLILHRTSIQQKSSLINLVFNAK